MENNTRLGMAQNVAGLICNAPCCIGLIFSAVALVVEKDNKFVKFHAFQSLLLHGVGFVCWVGLQIMGIVVGMLLGPLVALVGLLGLAFAVAFLGAQIFMMIKANNNEQFKLPVLGDLASQWS